VAEPWNAREAGAGLLAAVTRAISEERMRAAATGRLLQDSDLARAVLRSPALRDANAKMLDAMMTEYEPKVAALVAAEAVPLAEAAVAAETVRREAAEAQLAALRAALRRHVPSFTDPSGVVLCGGCLLAAPCPDAALAGEP
jgi:hypothetical protein